MRPFRRGDVVTVHWTGEVCKGRVICHNRKSQYDLSVVVLYVRNRDSPSYPECEYIESFQPNGKRYRKNDPVYISHGWADDT